MTISNQPKAERFIGTLRHCQLLGLKVLDADENSLRVRLPYSQQIIGNPLSGVVHGGSLTTLMDTACGTAVFIALPGFELCPTLDLRVDYMKAAEPKQDLVADASVTRTSGNVVFTECLVRQENNGEVVAKCNAAFMRIGEDMTPADYRQLIETGNSSFVAKV